MHSILIIEDDKSTRMMLTAFFRGQGFFVFAEANGRDGLQCALQEKTDVILLDVILPYLDGFSVLQKLRQNKVLTPVIMLTDCDDVSKKVKGLEFGADDYATKPFSTRELGARVNVQLRKTAQDKSASVKPLIILGNLEIDVSARSVRNTVTGEIKLTKTEFDIFYCLAQNAGQVVEYSTLLQDILGYQQSTVTKSIAMHIANLRKKMMLAECSDLKISAVAGVGYTLKEKE